MASPQKENGFTGIANEILEKVIATPFIATHLKIILVCWRYSYGFNTKAAKLSESFIANATGISKRYISRELKILFDCKVLNVVKEASYTSPRVIAFNKNYDEWEYRTTVPQEKQSSTVEAEYSTTVEPQFNTTGELQFHQKRKHKESIKEKSIDDFFNQVWALYPLKKGKNKVSNSSKKELYKISYEELARAIERYKKYVESNSSWLKYQHGSTFLNGGYIDYLDANYKEEKCEVWGWDR